MFKVLVTTEKNSSNEALLTDLKDAGFEIIANITDVTQLLSTAVETQPDLIIASSESPTTALFAAAKSLGDAAPCPFVLFTTDDNLLNIEHATASNVQAYVIDGYAKHRLRSIIQVAQARFRHEQVLKDALADLSKRFEERKLVDRAKGLLMHALSFNEEQAFEMLRSLAMKSRIRIGVVAKNVIDISRATEAVNRAGQLRMLSQRIVRCYAQVIINLNSDEALSLLSETAVRIDSNIGILEKAVATEDYSDLVDQVKRTWQQMISYSLEQPRVAHLHALNTLAEEMLIQAESLTNFLDDTGLVSTLHILNVSGKQRMYSQRIAKLCLMLCVEPNEAILRELQKMCERFELALTYLNHAPLTTITIAKNLVLAQLEWQKLRQSLAQKSELDTLYRILDSSEQLLNTFEQLTDQYEQAMQLLISDQLSLVA